MLSRVLVLLAVLFAGLAALRVVLAPPRPRWVQAAIIGVLAALPLLLLRMGGIAILAGVLVAGAVIMRRRPTPPGPVDTDMSRACALLGVGTTATEAEIRAAHRRKIAEAHPDRGGAPARAAALNAARDLLLKRARQPR